MKMKCAFHFATPGQPIKTPEIFFLAANYICMILIVTTPLHPYTKCRKNEFHFILPPLALIVNDAESVFFLSTHLFCVVDDFL